MAPNDARNFHTQNVMNAAPSITSASRKHRTGQPRLQLGPRWRGSWWVLRVTQALVTRNMVDAGLTPRRVRGMYTGRYRQAGALPVNSALSCQKMRASLSIMPAQRS
jgi:hypothetical protein